MGSDADVLVLVASAEEPFQRRAVRYDLHTLPLPADVLVYTISEWARLPDDTAFHRRVQREVVWGYRRDSDEDVETATAERPIAERRSAP